MYPFAPLNEVGIFKKNWNLVLVYKEISTFANGFDTLEKTERASKIPASTRKNTWTDIWANAEAEAIPSAATAWAESANNSVATKVKRLLVEATTSNDAAIAASTAISVLLFLL